MSVFVVAIPNVDQLNYDPFLHLNYDSVDTNEKTKIQVRLINDSSKITLKNLIGNFNWNSIVNSNADIYTENFIYTLNNLYCTAFPLKNKIC